MKTLSACLYCAKKKECTDSIKSHSFTDSCFMTEDESIRAAFEDLQLVSKNFLPVEVSEKINGAAEALLEQSKKISVFAEKTESASEVHCG